MIHYDTIDHRMLHDVTICYILLPQVTSPRGPFVAMLPFEIQTLCFSYITCWAVHNMAKKDDCAGHDETPEGKLARDATDGMMPAEGKSPGVCETVRELLMLNMHGMTVGGKGSSPDQLVQARREWLDSRYELMRDGNGARAASTGPTRPSPYGASGGCSPKALRLSGSLLQSQSQCGEDDGAAGLCVTAAEDASLPSDTLVWKPHRGQMRRFQIFPDTLDGTGHERLTSSWNV